ncbi:MAG: TonB-dependent receptor [Porticoccaceae bacterium]|nr:TonB-dependent receptor [Porticoccaceae bacterium]
MKKLFFIGLPVVACSLLANIGMAEDMEEIIVTSSLIDTSASEISNPLHIIDAESIGNDASQSLGSLLDGLAGVVSSDFGAAVGQPIIRGLGGSRVRVLNNGKVVRDISALGPDHANEIDLGHLEQIEIVRGPSSLLYANGAIGGIVNVVDNSIAKQDIESPKFNLGAGYEDGNTGNTGNASYAGNIAGVNLTSSIQYANLGFYAIPEHAFEHGDKEEHKATVLENSDFANFGAKLGFSKIEDWGYAGLSIADSKSTYAIPFHGEEHDDGDHEGERVFTNIDSQTVNFEGKYNFNGGFVNSAEYYIRDTDYVLSEQHAEEHAEEEEGENHQDEGTIFKNYAKELGLKFAIGDQETTQKIALNVSEEALSIIGEEAFLPKAVSDELTIGYYLSHDLSFAHMDLGVRHDQIDRKSGTNSIEENVTSFSTAIHREFSDNLNISLGLSTVQKAPTSMELFVDGPHLATQRYERGNASLSPEKANNIDLTFNAAFAGFEANLSLYKNSISNFIYLHDLDTELDKLTVAEYRQQDTTFEGYELQISRTIPVESGNIEVSLARDYVDAQFKQGGYVPRMAPARNILNLSYQGANELNWSLSIKDVQKQSKVATGETATDGYQWVNFHLSKDIKAQQDQLLKVSLFAKNLLNKVARNHSSYVKDEVPLPGRNIGIRASYSF